MRVAHSACLLAILMSTIQAVTLSTALDAVAAIAGGLTTYMLQTPKVDKRPLHQCRVRRPGCELCVGWFVRNSGAMSQKRRDAITKECVDTCEQQGYTCRVRDRIGIERDDSDYMVYMCTERDAGPGAQSAPIRPCYDLPDSTKVQSVSPE